MAAQHMADLVVARSATSLRQALRELGARSELGSDMTQLYRTFSRYVVVTRGSEATRHWRLSENDDASTGPHVLSLCGFCETAGIHCTCEHIHAALIATGRIRMEAADLPLRGRGHRAPVELSLLSPQGPSLAKALAQRYQAPSESAASTNQAAADGTMRKLLNCLQLL